MRKRNFHTSINLLIIREGIKLRLAQYDKENNSIVTESQ